MACFIKRGVANKAALCEGFRRTCHHGKATDTRKAPGSPLFVAGIHLRPPIHVGWAHSPCFGSVPDPYSKQCHTAALAFGPAFSEMFFLFVCPVTDGLFFQSLPDKSLVWPP